VVAISVAEKRTGVKITWAEYCKVAVPSTFLTVLVCSLLVYLKYLRP
jgi:Na+/H+ antiporter NhaD/arsenite permease-like protein